ncbi:hypothetical protein ACFSX9_15440 [Flavobacterium ardleyense]|uniref:SMI1/KNR4 family protein n=1 Tax=Flavobacterium ardleyense TaxID=2038737 RepID=A0ABW5ZBG6_9FLAO
MEMDLLGDRQRYVEEPLETFEIRYSGFGKDLYNEIQKELPEVFAKLTYYKRFENDDKSNLMTFLNDSYAIYNDGSLKFRIIIDPDCEVICLGDFDSHIEIGSWDNTTTYYRESIDFIKKYFLKI